jgi:3-oxoacyl-[acyl-carrier-protein] synthase-3
MRYDDLFIAGLGSYLPKAVPVEEAVLAGRYDAEEQASSGQQAVTVAGDDDAQPDMAVRAGQLALARSNHPGADVCLLLHAVTGHNGLEGWNAAAYVQWHVLGRGGTSMEVRQLSNGAVASVELAAAYLAADPTRRAAMITAADRFSEPAYDRWWSSWGLVFADGASAAVLSRDGGFARVVAAVTRTDPELEILHRGTLPFTAVAGPDQYPVDFRARTLDSSQFIDFDAAGERIGAGLVDVVRQATAEAGCAVSDVDHYVVPNFGRELLHKQCVDVLGIDASRTTLSWAAHVGHLGAADQFAGLTYLSESGRLAPGDRVLILGVGGGFNWTCLALEVIAEPTWA